MFVSLIFHDLAFEKDCSNSPGSSILLNFSQIVAQGYKFGICRLTLFRPGAQRFLSITLRAFEINLRNVVTFPKIYWEIRRNFKIVKITAMIT